ncbi:MAG: hypothetical protein CXR30_02945 [Geobacter sp.]|nr:MAG: hypothetical protein CXR30_02945 [Geobacter sp.]
MVADTNGTPVSMVSNPPHSASTTPENALTSSFYPDQSAQSVAIHHSTIKLPLGARNDRFGTHRSNALRAIAVADAAPKALLVTREQPLILVPAEQAA